MRASIVTHRPGSRDLGTGTRKSASTGTVTTANDSPRSESRTLATPQRRDTPWSCLASQRRRRERASRRSIRVARSVQARGTRMRLTPSPQVLTELQHRHRRLAFERTPSNTPSGQREGWHHLDRRLRVELRLAHRALVQRRPGMRRARPSVVRTLARASAAQIPVTGQSSMPSWARNLCWEKPALVLKELPTHA